jgi:Transglutaminase-like superfamily
MAPLRVGQRARHFMQRDRFVKLWFVPVWLGLGLASLIIAAVPFRQIAPRLGKFWGTSTPALPVSPAQEARGLQIKRVLQLAAFYAPWRADCYPQAIAARLLMGLYRLPFTLFLGLKRDSATGETRAHAWTLCGQIEVSGGGEAEEYRVVAIFSSVHRSG